MSSLLEGVEKLERELVPEPIAAPAVGSLAFHAALAGCLVLYGVIGGFLHHSNWGDAGIGGAIQVNLVSSALPLPSDQPPNKNVLATQTPSQAPAEPTPKAKLAQDENAIPILGKKVKPEQQAAPKTPPHQTQNNRAQYGEQSSSSMPHVMQNSGAGPTSIDVGDFGSRFGWYVDAINRKMATSWYKGEVDPRTPKGARVYLTFTIRKDGTQADVTIDRSSGSYTLDNSCKRGVQRVDTFGNLPSAYNSSTLKVSYYCEY
jgi:protein TonB